MFYNNNPPDFLRDDDVGVDEKEKEHDDDDDYLTFKCNNDIEIYNPRTSEIMTLQEEQCNFSSCENTVMQEKLIMENETLKDSISEREREIYELKNKLIQFEKNMRKLMMGQNATKVQAYYVQTQINRARKEVEKKIRFLLDLNMKEKQKLMMEEQSKYNTEMERLKKQYEERIQSVNQMYGQKKQNIIDVGKKQFVKLFN